MGPCAPQREVDQLFDELGHMKLDTPDRTFSEFLGQRNLRADALALATNYVEGFNAADASRISLQSLAKQQAAEDAIEGDRLFRVAEGYAEVPAFLMRRFLDAGGEWVPSCPVRSIGWKPGRVEVLTANDRAFPCGRRNHHFASGCVAGETCRVNAAAAANY